MTKQFDKWEQCFKDDDIVHITLHSEGMLWFKLKSIIRRELIFNFCKDYNIKLLSTKLNDSFKELFEILLINVEKSHHMLNEFILKTEANNRKLLNINEIVNELYNLKSFIWGGDYSNALDKYLVNNYIKIYKSYDMLVSKIDNEINHAVYGYVMCSWYNHWSSILIENIFKQHPIVLPTVGQVKKVDFFVNNIPFDLKVTYMPVNYIEKKRKEAGLRSELAELKNIAKQLKIQYLDSEQNLKYILSEKIKDKADPYGLTLFNKIKEFKLELISDLLNDPTDLIKNLYEEQGELRFDASNRLFLILVDRNDFDSSWKLKRNMDLLMPNIFNYLDNFKNKTIEDLKISFSYKNKGKFNAFSDCIFIVK